MTTHAAVGKKRPSGISAGPDGLADVVPTDKGRFPPSAESLFTQER